MLAAEEGVEHTVSHLMRRWLTTCCCFRLTAAVVELDAVQTKEQKPMPNTAL